MQWKYRLKGLLMNEVNTEVEECRCEMLCVKPDAVSRRHVHRGASSDQFLQNSHVTSRCGLVNSREAAGVAHSDWDPQHVNRVAQRLLQRHIGDRVVSQSTAFLI